VHLQLNVLVIRVGDIFERTAVHFVSPFIKVSIVKNAAVVTSLLPRVEFPEFGIQILETIGSVDVDGEGVVAFSAENIFKISNQDIFRVHASRLGFHPSAGRTFHILQLAGGQELVHIHVRVLLEALARAGAIGPTPALPCRVLTVSARHIYHAIATRLGFGIQTELFTFING
jgi:hypothetical protein